MDKDKASSPVECVRIRQFDISPQWQRSVPRRKLTFHETALQRGPETHQMLPGRGYSNGNAIFSQGGTEAFHSKMLEVTRSPKQSRLLGYQRQNPQPLKHQQPLAYEVPVRAHGEDISKQAFYGAHGLHQSHFNHLPTANEDAINRTRGSSNYTPDRIKARNLTYDRQAAERITNLDSDFASPVKSGSLFLRTPTRNENHSYNGVTDLHLESLQKYGIQSRNQQEEGSRCNPRSHPAQQIIDRLHNGPSVFQRDDKTEIRRKEYDIEKETAQKQGHYHGNVSKDEWPNCYERIGLESQNFRNAPRESPNMRGIIQVAKSYASPSKDFIDENSFANNENSSTGNQERHLRENNAPIRQCIVRELDADQIKRSHTQRGDNRRTVVQFVVTGSEPSKDKEASNIITLIDESFRDYYKDKRENNDFMRKGLRNEGAIKSVNLRVSEEIEKQSTHSSEEDKDEVRGASLLCRGRPEKENKHEFVRLVEERTEDSVGEESTRNCTQKSLSNEINANSNSREAGGEGRSFEQIKRQLFIEAQLNDATTTGSKAELNRKDPSLTRTIHQDCKVGKEERAYDQKPNDDVVFFANKSHGQLVYNADKHPAVNAVLKTPKSHQRLNRDNKSPFIRTVYQDCGQHSTSDGDANTSGRPVSPFSDSIITAAARSNLDCRRSAYMKLRTRDRRLRYLSEPGKFRTINAASPSVLDRSGSSSLCGSSCSEELTEREDTAGLKLTEKALRAHTMALKANSPSIRKRPTLDQFFGRIEEHVLQDSASDTSEISTNSDSVLMIQKANKFNLTPVSGLMKDGAKYSSASSRAKRLKAWKSRHEKPTRSSRPSASELLAIKSSEGYEESEGFPGVKEVSSDGESGDSSLDYGEPLRETVNINTIDGELCSEGNQSSFNAAGECNRVDNVSGITVADSEILKENFGCGRIGDSSVEDGSLRGIDVNGNFKELNSDICMDKKSMASEDSFEEVFVEPELLSCEPSRTHFLNDEKSSLVGNESLDSKQAQTTHKQQDSLDVFVGSASAILERVRRLQLKYKHRSSTDEVGGVPSSDDVPLTAHESSPEHLANTGNGYPRNTTDDSDSKVSKDAGQTSQVHFDQQHSLREDLLEKAASRKFTVHLDKRSSCSLEELSPTFGSVKVKSPCFSSEEDLRSFRQRDANSSMNSYEISKLLKELDDVVDRKNGAICKEEGGDSSKKLQNCSGNGTEEVPRDNHTSRKEKQTLGINSNGILSSHLRGHGDKNVLSNDEVEKGSNGFSLDGNQELEFQRECKAVNETKLLDIIAGSSTVVSDRDGSWLMKDDEQQSGERNTSCAVEESAPAELKSISDNYTEICTDKARGISSLIEANGNFQSTDFVNSRELNDKSILKKTKSDTTGQFANFSPSSEKLKLHYYKSRDEEDILLQGGQKEFLNQQLLVTGEACRSGELVNAVYKEGADKWKELDHSRVFLGHLEGSERYNLTPIEDVYEQNDYEEGPDGGLEASSIEMAHGKGVSDLKRHFEKYQPKSQSVASDQPQASSPKSKEDSFAFPTKRSPSSFGALKSLFESSNEGKGNTSMISQDSAQRVSSPKFGRPVHVAKERKSPAESAVVVSKNELQGDPRVEDGKPHANPSVSGDLSDVGFDFRSKRIADETEKQNAPEGEVKSSKIPPPIKRKPSLKKTENSAKKTETSRDSFAPLRPANVGSEDETDKFSKDQSTAKTCDLAAAKRAAEERIKNGGKADDTMQPTTDNSEVRRVGDIGLEENQNTEARPKAHEVGLCSQNGSSNLTKTVKEQKSSKEKEFVAANDKEQNLSKEVPDFKSVETRDGSIDISTIGGQEAGFFRAEDQLGLIDHESKSEAIAMNARSLGEQSKNARGRITQDQVPELLRPSNPLTNVHEQSDEAAMDLGKSFKGILEERESVNYKAIDEPIKTEKHAVTKRPSEAAEGNKDNKMLQCTSSSHGSNSSLEGNGSTTMQNIENDSLAKLGHPTLKAEADKQREMCSGPDNKKETSVDSQEKQPTSHEQCANYSEQAPDIKTPDMKNPEIKTPDIKATNTKSRAPDVGAYMKTDGSRATDRTPDIALNVMSIEQKSDIEAKSAKEALKSLDSRLEVIKVEASKFGIHATPEVKDATTSKKLPTPIIIQSAPSMPDRNGLPNVAKVSPYFHDSSCRTFIEPVQRFGADIFGDLLEGDILDGIAKEHYSQADEQVGNSLKRNLESKGHSLEGIQKLTIGLDIAGGKLKPESLDIGVASVDGMKTWTEVEEEVVNTFLNHLKLIDNAGLGITRADIKHFTIGRHQIALGAGRELHCYSMDKTSSNHRIEIQGNALNNVATLAYQSLIPKKTLEKYMSLALNHRCLVFSGPSGTGKSFLANLIADALSSRIAENNNSFEPIHTVNIDAEKWKELKKVIESRASESRPVVVVIDGFSSEFQEGIDNLSLLYKKTDYKHVYVIAALEQASTEDVIVTWPGSMRWICLDNNEEPVCGLLIRYLRKKFLNNNPSSDWDELFKLSKWILTVWKQLNKVIERFHSQEKSIGPAMFFSCPTRKDEIEEWFVDLWNYSLAPYILHVMRTGLKLFGQRGEWMDPLETILDTYPWQQEENLLPRIKKIRKDDVGYKEVLPSDEGLASASTNQVRFMNFLRRLETLVENKRIVTETKPGTTQRRIYLESTL